MTHPEPSLVDRLYRPSHALLRSMRSENIGGLVSMAGSCLFMLGGDASGTIVTLSFIVAEIVLVRHGHRRAGYSAGCALFSFGDALAVFSEVAHGNPAFQITLAAMAVTWLVGAARAPLAWLGERSQRPALVAAADALQPISGVLTIVLRLPGIVTAIGGANYLGAAAVACWAAADILVGRLQDLHWKFAHRRRASSADDATH